MFNMGPLQQRMSLVLLYVMQLLVLSSAKGEDLQCGVCRAIVNEINLSIRSADPKKKVQVGSFRVDSKGNQQTVDIPLSRSEVFLVEQFENLCERMPNWGVLMDKDTGRRAVIRKYNMEGALVDGIDKNVQSRLTSMCYSFLEDFEEEAIPIFQKEGVKEDDQEKELCIDMTGLCTAEEIKYQASAQSKGIRDAIMKQAQAGKDTLNISPGGGAEEEDDDDDDGDGDDDNDDKNENEKDDKDKKAQDEVVNEDKKDEL